MYNYNKCQFAGPAPRAQRNIEEAAKAAGIGAKTLLRWLKVPEFEKAYREAPQHRIRGIAGGIRSRRVQVLKREKNDEDDDSAAAET